MGDDIRSQLTEFNLVGVESGSGVTCASVEMTRVYLTPALQKIVDQITEIDF